MKKKFKRVGALALAAAMAATLVQINCNGLSGHEKMDDRVLSW